MRPISLETLAELYKDNFYLNCCICRNTHPQFHHHLIFGGRQQDDVDTILPLCSSCHFRANEKNMRERLDWILLSRMSEKKLKQYSKVDDLLAKRDRLISKYGNFHNEKIY